MSCAFIKTAFAVFSVLALTGGLRASDLLSESNSQSIFLPLGIGLGNGQQAAAIEFSTSNPLSNVTIGVPLDVTDFYASGQNVAISAYLTNSFGPATTAGNVLDSVQLGVAPNNSASDYYSYNYNAVNQTLFSNLSLAPGTYDIVLAELDGAPDAGIPLDFAGGTLMNAPGVKFLGSFTTAQQSGTFVPGYSGWGDTSQASIFAGPLEFNITGNDLVSGAPEPAFQALSGLLLLVGVGAVRSLQRNFRQEV